MSSATTMGAFKPINTLKHDWTDVQFELPDGKIVKGWMMIGSFQARSYWTVDDGVHTQVSPTRWRPLPFPIAQRNAA